MSLFSKLLGRRNPVEEATRADALFARGEHGVAKLAYERARDACGPEDAALRDACDQKADACCDAIARTRLAEARTFFANGNVEIGVSELEHAAQTAKSKELLAEIELEAERAVRKEAREQATIATLTEDERYELLSGDWEAEQYAEYVAAGDQARRALLALHEGDAATARPLLEAAVEANPECCYLRLELGRARLLTGDATGGRSALEKFLAGLPADEGGDARLTAHVELAALLHAEGDVEAAIAQHQAAIDALPEDPRPYLALGRFLRRVEMPEEAIEVLESVAAMLGEEQPQLAIVLENGLAHAEAGLTQRATELLEQTVTMLTARGQLDLPPELAIKLAELHEQAGNPARALDLYALLTQGSDRAQHFVYHREMGRLLALVGQGAEARRAYQRALEVAPDDPELRASLQAAIEALQS